MLTEVSDDDLRSMLAKYIDNVPPVTESTRPTLIKKLEKYVIEDLQAGTPIEAIDSHIANDLPNSPKRRNSVEATAIAVPSSPSRSKVPPQLVNESLRPSPVMEYASRLPTYRRRSIHPERPGLCSPYSEFCLPEANTLDDGSNLPSSPKKWMLGVSRHRITEKRNVTFRNAVATIANSLLGLPTSVVRELGRFRMYLVSARVLLVLLTVACLVVLGAYFLLGDPFYYNPVNDFKSILQVREN